MSCGMKTSATPGIFGSRARGRSAELVAGLQVGAGHLDVDRRRQAQVQTWIHQAAG